MNIAIPDELLRGTNLTHDEAMLDFAIGLFVDNRITVGRGARIAGLKQPEFIKELGKRRIPLHYDAEDFAADVEILKNL